jgi:hypothetical protein
MSQIRLLLHARRNAANNAAPVALPRTPRRSTKNPDTTVAQVSPLNREQGKGRQDFSKHLTNEYIQRLIG